MWSGFSISAILHTSLVFALIFALPAPARLDPVDASHMVVELLDIADETVISLAPKPQPAPAPTPRAAVVSRPDPTVEPSGQDAPDPGPEPVTQIKPSTPAPAEMLPEPSDPTPEPEEPLAPKPVKRPPQPPESPPDSQDPDQGSVSQETSSQKKKDTPVFDAGKIASLLDKKLADRHETPVVSPDADPEGPAEGTLNQDAPLTPPAPVHLSMSEVDAIRHQYYQCWRLPLGAPSNQDLSVRLRVWLDLDGALERHKIIRTGSQSSAFLRPMIESVERAVIECSPLQFLPREKYDQWREIELLFDPTDLLG